MNPIQHASFCEICGGVLEADSDSWNKESKEICLTLFIASIWVIEKKREKCTVSTQFFWNIL